MKKYTLPIVAISTGIITAGGVSSWDWHKRPMSLPGMGHMFLPASVSQADVMAAFNRQAPENSTEQNSDAVRQELEAMGFDQSSYGTVLVLAASQNNIHLARGVLTLNPDVNATDESGNSALIWAAYNGSAELVRLLVAVNGINLNYVDSDGKSALRWAEDKGHTECAQVLRDAGAQSICAEPTDSTSAELTQEEAAAKLQQMGITPDSYDEALCAATDDSDNEKIRLLIIAGANVNCDAEDGWSPITNVCLYGNAEGLRLLLAAPGIDVNRPNAKGDNAIIWAAVKGEVECLRLLLAVPGINVNFIDSDGKTAYEWARRHGYRECVELLRAAGGVTAAQARNNGTPEATTPTTPVTDSSEAAARLQQMGITPDAYDEALCSATDNSENELISLLIAAGANVNCDAEDGWSPITNVCLYGNVEGLRLLLAAPGIDVNRPNSKGDNAIIWAAVKGETECLQLLLAVPGINVNFIDSDGKTAYEWAQQNGHRDCAEILRTAGGVTAAQSRNNEGAEATTPTTPPADSSEAAARLQQMGITPDAYDEALCAATDNNENEQISLLIAAGANVNCDAEDGWSPITNVCLYGNVEGLRLLLAAPGIDVNRPNSKGDNAIIWAAVKGEVECLRLLLAVPGINVNFIDSDGKTAYEWARQNGHRECAELLRAAGGVTAAQARNNEGAETTTPIIDSSEAAARLQQMGITPDAYDEALCAATDNSENEQIRLLIAAGANVNCDAEDGWSPITNVCLYGNVEGLRLLLAAPGIDANRPNSKGDNAIIWAAVKGELECLRLLLAVPGIDVNFIDCDGKTAYEWARQNGHQECAELLRAAGGVTAEQVRNNEDPEATTPFTPAANSTEAAERLQQMGITPDAYNEALCSATDNSENELISLLITAGANVNSDAEDGWSPITNVCLYGNTEGLRLLLAAPGIDVNRPNSKGDNAIIWATVKGEVECLQLLLAVPGIDVNFIDSDGKTAYEWALHNGHQECVELLRAAGGVTAAQARNNGTPETTTPATQPTGDAEAAAQLQQMGITPDAYNRVLCAATDNNDNETIRLLIAAGADVNHFADDGFTPITNVCLYGNAEGLRMLLAAPGINVNLANRRGDTAIIWAAVRGEVECLRLLLEVPGIDVNFIDSDGKTAFEWALEHDFEDCVELLRAAGGLIAEEVRNGSTSDTDPATPEAQAAVQLGRMGIPRSRFDQALCNATDRSNNELIRLLITAGADVNAQGEDGWTPLTNVCLYENIEGLRLLLAAPGIDVNKPNQEGNVPLVVAARCNNEEIRNLLQAAGANLPVDSVPAPENGDRAAQQRLLELGITPSRYNQALCDATDNRDNERIQLLIAAGADVNHQGNDGWTPLTNCCLYGNLEGMRLLLAAPGIDINRENRGGETPYEVAVRKMNGQAMQILREAGYEVPVDNTPAPENGDAEAQQQLRDMGITPGLYGQALCDATDNSDNEKIRLLIAAGADVNHQGNDGWTPLTNCCVTRNVQGLRMLLDAPGIDVNKVNGNGDTAFAVASERNITECLRVLRQAGITESVDNTPAPANGDPEAQQRLSEMGITPGRYNRALCDATDADDNEKIRLLIAAGANVNCNGPDGWTPLTNVCLSNNPEGLRLLLAVPGIDVNRTNRNGNTALQIAGIRGHEACVRILREAGVTAPEDNTPAPANGDAEAQQQLRDMGITPSHYNMTLCNATDNRRNNLIRLLVAAGADVNCNGSDGWTPLTNCCLSNNPEGVRILLAAPGIDVNKPNQRGLTPVQVATDKGSYECVRLLREAGATLPTDNTPLPANGNPEAQQQLSEIGITPSRYNQALCDATDNRDNERIQLLIAAGADVNHQGNDGWTPLTNCCLYGNAEGLSLLLAAPGIDINKPNRSGNTPLQVATEKGNTECVRLLRAAGASIPEDNTPAPANGDPEAQQQLREMGITPSHYNRALCNATDNDRNELIRLLVAAGADVNCYGADGWTPLTNVCLCDNPEGLRLLLAAPGIEVNKPNRGGRTALEIATQKGSTECLRLLFEAGIAIPEDDTPAPANGDSEAQQQLREMGITPSRYDQALCNAADNSRNDLIRLLIAAGADVNAFSDMDGYTPLTNVCVRSNTEGLGLLLAAPGIEVNKPNTTGDTAIIFVAIRGDVENLRMLMAVPGIDINFIDSDNKTALDWATENGHTECVNILREAGAKSVRELR